MNPLYLLLLIPLGLILWLVLRNKKPAVAKKAKKTKPVVFEHVESKVVDTTSGKEKVETRKSVTADEFKKKNNGIPAGMPSSFAVRD